MKTLLLFVCLFTSSITFSQVKTFDNLERIYAQKHYKIVKRKASRAMDNPDYDYSMIPTLYKSMSLFQLCKNERWFDRHSNALQEAADLFKKIKQSSDGMRVFNAHIYEISSLKRDLFSWAEDLKRNQNNSIFKELTDILNVLFDDVPNIDLEGEQDPSKFPKEIATSSEALKSSSEMTNYAKTFIGTPYLWAGEDPKGFDCSGYTGYVYLKSGITLPRRASEQYDKSKKIKQSEVKVGDLVFFDSGSGISHVGIMLSSGNEPMVMIHSSTSKGIIITEIEKSEYWLKRLSGFGSYH
jgi:peptidoglycan DL-endopeptidase CwlO